MAEQWRINIPAQNTLRLGAEPQKYRMENIKERKGIEEALWPERLGHDKVKLSDQIAVCL